LVKSGPDETLQPNRGQPHDAQMLLFRVGQPHSRKLGNGGNVSCWGIWTGHADRCDCKTLCPTDKPWGTDPHPGRSVRGCCI